MSLNINTQNLTINKNETSTEKKTNNTSRKLKKSSKKELKSMSDKYRYAYNFLFNSYPRWKQLAIVEDLQAKRQDSYLVDEFVKEVICIAENNTK